MDRIIAFSALLVLASGYAMARGGRPEKIVGFSFLVAFGLSIFFQQPVTSRFLAIEWGVLTVDLALLAVLIGVALFADRYWPLWIAAFQALATGGHMVRGLDHGIEPVAYAILLASWSYPMILLLALGTLRHDQRGRRGGRDMDWSVALPQLSRAG